MARLDKPVVSLSGLVPAIVKLIKEWQPPKLGGEVKYRDHLLNYLRESVPTDTIVEKEYRNRGTTIDIWIDWKGLIFNDDLAIEIKLNLNRKSDFDRLIGQIESLGPRENNTIIVLIGKTDPALLSRLNNHYSSLLAKEDFDPTFAIVNVEATVD